MVVEHDDTAEESLAPTADDVLRLRRELNSRHAEYIVIGGMAMIQAGFVRTTEDIDLLIEGSKENQGRVRAALATLPDDAVRELQADDLDRYAVVRVADEIVVDFMKSAWGIDFAQSMISSR